MARTGGVEPARIRDVNDRPPVAGRYVLYWMQQSQRAEWNPALEFAIATADEMDLAVVVGFGLTGGYPESNLRHYTFMLEGLRETAASLAARGLAFVLRRGDPAEVALELARGAAVVVGDCGHLRHQRAWRKRVAREAPCRVVQVESDVI